MRPEYFAAFALSFFTSLAMTLAVLRYAVRRHIVDEPDKDRRFHQRPTPTLGGLAVYGGFLVVTIAALLAGYFADGNIPLRQLAGILAGGMILMVGGYLDDKYRLAPRQSIIFPVLACLAVVFAGVEAVSVHNPLTGQVLLLGGITILGVPLASGLVIFLWTLGMTYTTKFLDGMDGLATGISAIAGMVIFGLSLTPDVQQPQTALLAVTFVGALLGFLILNFYPAKIFLGESGSTFAGFMLAILAVVSGGKIATAILVMGIPVLDTAWVIIQRLASRQSPFKGDRRHLHYRLTEIGFSEPQAVLFLYALSGIFGVSALFLQSMGKLIAFGILIFVMAAIIVGASVAHRIRRAKNVTPNT